MTPYTWRNFVNGAPMAREGQMEQFFSKKAFKYQKYKSVELGVPCWNGPGALECVHLCHNLELATESSYNVEIYYNCIVIGW